LLTPGIREILEICTSVQNLILGLFLVWVFGMFRPCLFPIDSEISEVQTDDHGAAQKVYDELLKLDAQCQQLSTAIWSSKGQLHPGHKITRE
jgi:hypothetical protein